MDSKQILIEHKTWELLKIESAKKEVSILSLATHLLNKALQAEESSK